MIGFWRKSGTEVSISPIATDDLQQCADIHAQSFSTPWGDGTLDAMLKSDHMHGIVAKSRKQSGANLVGFLLYSIAGNEAEIITIATKKSARKSGIAKAMLEELIRLCLSDRLSEIFLEVDENNAAALGLYRKSGFKKVGERKGYYDNTQASNSKKNSTSAGNALIMRLNLLD